MKDEPSGRHSESFFRGKLDIQRPVAIASGLIAGGLVLAENFFSTNIDAISNADAIVGGIVTVALSFAIGSILTAGYDSLKARNAASSARKIQ